MWEYTVARACMRILLKKPKCIYISRLWAYGMHTVGESIGNRSRYVIGIVFLEESVSTYEKSKNIWCINKAILAYLNCGDLCLTAS